MQGWRHLSKIVVLASVACVTVLPPGRSSAETLQDAWAAALTTDQGLASVNARAESARLSLGAAKAERYPSVDLGTSATQLDDAPRFSFGANFVSPELVSDDRILTASGRIHTPLYTGGMLRDRIESANATVVAREQDVGTTEQAIKLAVAELYVGVLRRERALEVAQSVAARLRAHTADTKNRFDTGAIPKNDYLATAVSLADAEQRVIQASNALDIARSAYNRQLGRPLTDPVALDPSLRAVEAPQSVSVEELIARALERRHELQALDAQADAFRYDSSAIEARRRPQLGLTGGYTYLENDVLDRDELWWLGVGVTWNLFDSGRVRTQAGAMERLATAADRQRQDLETIIALEVRQTWLDWQEARQRIGVTEAAVSQADENLKVSVDRYQAGAGTNTDVLAAQALRALSLNNRDNAFFDAALARMRLARAMGEL